jgi:hypothetical protein
VWHTSEIKEIKMEATDDCGESRSTLMMKSIRESTDMRHRTHFRIRMRKLLSGFLAVSTAITMLGGSAVTLMAEEPSTEYALAGAGTGQDITIHFGDDEDQIKHYADHSKRF